MVSEQQRIYFHCHLHGTRHGFLWIKLLTNFTSIIIKTVHARKNTTPVVWKKKCLMQSLWQQNRPLYGCRILKKSCVQCQRCIIFSTFIVWLNIKTLLLLNATKATRNLCFQRLVENKIKAMKGVYANCAMFFRNSSTCTMIIPMEWSNCAGP